MQTASTELSHYQDQDWFRERMQRIQQRPPVLTIDQLGKVFQTPGGPVEALHSIDCTVRRREFVCVIGQSGCGKSTLIRTLAGLEQPSSGRVLLDGQPVSEPGPERGMVFQGYSLFPWLTVQRNVAFGLEMADVPRHRADAEAAQWVEMVGLGRFAKHYPHQLSGGMQQRVAIARALANQPRILLMDEPFGALDAQTRSSMQAHLLQIWRAVNVTVLFITHDLDEAVFLADRILVLGANPGHVKEVVEVPVPRPRSSAQFLDPAFLATKNHIAQLIHPPGSESEDETALPLPRLTPVGDDVL